MKVELVVGIIGIVIAIFAVGIAGQTMINVNNQKTAEGFNWQVAPEFWKFVNENFVSEGEWKPHNEELLMKFENLDKKVDSLQSQVTYLQAKGDVITQPVPTTPPATSSIDLLMTVTDHKGVFKPSGYVRDVPAILIQGQSSFLEKSYLITIKDPSGNFVKDKFGQTLSDGDISQAWIPPATALAGNYVVTITIDGKKDSINFKLL